MNDFVLAVIGSIGIATLVLSMKNEKNEIREDFNSGFAYRNKLQKVTKDSNGNEHDLSSYNCTKSTNILKNKTNSLENFEDKRILGNGLGSKNITTSPYLVPTPHLNQNVNQPSPSLNLPSLLRYNAPSLSKIGVTENFQENKRIQENYNNTPVPYMNNKQNTVPPNFVEGKLPNQINNKNVKMPSDNLFKSDSFVDPFEGKEVMVFDRPMTTTLKVGRFALSGCRDLIRGDLPVAPNNCKGWFQTPADPSALSKGALQAIAGENESSSVLNKFMEQYGDCSGVGSGVNLSDDVSNQYTAYEMVMNNKGLGNNTLSVQNF